MNFINHENAWSILLLIKIWSRSSKGEDDDDNEDDDDGNDGKTEYRNSCSYTFIQTQKAWSAKPATKPNKKYLQKEINKTQVPKENYIYINLVSALRN